MGVIGTLIMSTTIAGVLGTGLGGLVGAMLQKDSNRIVSLLLSFAAGVMLSVVCFDLVTEAIETDVGVLIVIGAIAVGVIVIYLLNYLIDRNTNPEVPHIDANHPKTADDLDELIHSDHFEMHYAHKENRHGRSTAVPVVMMAYLSEREILLLILGKILCFGFDVIFCFSFPRRPVTLRRHHGGTKSRVPLPRKARLKEILKR